MFLVLLETPETHGALDYFVYLFSAFAEHPVMYQEMFSRLEQTLTRLSMCANPGKVHAQKQSVGRCAEKDHREG